MKPTPAQKLLVKLNTNIPAKHRKKIQESTKTCLLEFAKYLDEIKCNYVKKDNSENANYVIGVIFKNLNAINKPVEWNNFCKVSLSVANRKFQELVQIIANEKDFKRKTILKYKDLIRDYVFDLKYFVEYFEQKSNSAYVFFRGGKSYNNHTYELFFISNNLYWNSIYRQNIFDQKMALNIACFTLRQSLELKFKRICGVYEINNEDYNGPKLRHEFFAEFIEENNEHFELPYASLTELLKIYKWTNYAIHNAENPLIWELKFALDYTHPFFKWGEDISRGTHVKSIFGAIRIKDYPNLQKKLQAKLDAQFPSEKISIKYIKEPEAIIIE